MAVAELFATLVGLVVMFRDERALGTNATKEEFVGWLEAHKHEEIKQLVVENGAIGLALDKMLKDQHGQVMGELSELNKITTGIAHNLASLSGLASAVDAAAPRLSEQCISILQQYNAAEASKALEYVLMSGRGFTFMDGSRGEVTISDRRFIESDLTDLCAIGLLTLDYNGKGDRIFHITRAGAKIGESSPPAS